MCFRSTMPSATERVESASTGVATTGMSLYWLNDTSTSATAVAELGPVIFRIIVIVIATVGALANATVLYTLCKSKQLKMQAVNMLFINQMSLDLFSCVSVIVTYSLWIDNVYLSGTSGYLLCIFLLSDNTLWFGLYGSKVSLVSIAIERYVKIVHPIWHKRNFRPWMTYLGVSAAWIIGALASFVVGTLTTVVVDGQCFWGAVWPGDALKTIYAILNFTLFFVMILLVFAFCYGRIVLAVRRQARTFAVQHANNPLANANSIQSLRIQMNAVKTMIAISAAFVIFWLPIDCLALISMINDSLYSLTDVYYVSLFAANFNMCTNPFIYAAKYDLVKSYLMKHTPCCKNAIMNSQSVNVIPLPTGLTSHR